VLGSFVTEAINEVKENNLSRGKAVLIEEMIKCPEIESITEST
jgi:hypothetical protein